MRKLIENPVFMTYASMKEAFHDKWILITNCEYSERDDFIGGVPVAVADDVFEGQGDGFYDEFKDLKYAPRTDLDFSSEPPPLFRLHGYSDYIEITQDDSSKLRIEL